MSATRGHTAYQRGLSDYAKRLAARGWVANHDGNISLRAPDGQRFYATPTATAKAEVGPGDTVIVDLEGKKLSGTKRLFSEWHLHAACYRARPDVQVVMHAHPPCATAFGLAGRSLGVPALPEMVVSLGANVPLIPYAMPKSASQDNDIAKALTEGDADAMLIAHNGVLIVGQDLEQAYLRLELVEHYAQILTAAAGLGPLRALPGDDVKKLLAARTKAGLGAAARRG